jgi:IS30 family transposase
MKRYKQLSYEQRCQIYVLKKSKMTQQAIADTIAVSQSGISREFKRTRGERGYRYKQAQRMCAERHSQTSKAFKMTPDMIELIESKLSDKWGPEQISGWLQSERDESLSHESIYRHLSASIGIYGQIK